MQLNFLPKDTESHQKEYSCRISAKSVWIAVGAAMVVKSEQQVKVVTAAKNPVFKASTLAPLYSDLYDLSCSSADGLCKKS